MDLSRRNFLGWSAVGLAGLLVPSRELVRPAAKVFDMGRGLARDESVLIYQGDTAPLVYDSRCYHAVGGDNGAIQVFVSSLFERASPQLLAEFRPDKNKRYALTMLSTSTSIEVRATPLPEPLS